MLRLRFAVDGSRRMNTDSRYLVYCRELPIGYAWDLCVAELDQPVRVVLSRTPRVHYFRPADLLHRSLLVASCARLSVANAVMDRLFALLARGVVRRA